MAQRRSKRIAERATRGDGQPAHKIDQTFYGKHYDKIDAPRKAHWRKLRGRDTRTGQFLIPQGVSKAQTVRNFPRTITETSRAAKGLRNSGIACYRNSMIQCLLHLPKFYHFLGRVHLDCNLKSGECTTCALQQLAFDYWRLPAGTTGTDTRLAKRMDQLLASMEHIILRNIPPTDPGNALRDDLEDDAQCSSYDFFKALVELMDYDLRDSARCLARLDRLFKYRLNHYWTCCRCNTLHDDLNNPSLEQHVGLDVDINTTPGLTYEQYIRQYRFRSSTRIRCPTAGCSANVSDSTGPLQAMRYRIHEPPDVLVVRQMRMYPKEDYSGIFKCCKRLQYKEYLDLSEYTPQAAPLHYRLDGVVFHRGDGDYTGGHFIAVVRAYDGSTFSLISDTQVSTGLDLDSLLIAPRRFQAYCLVYSKI